MSSKPKYFATYHGPSYGMGGDNEIVMGFKSLAEAKDVFRAFYSGSVWYSEYYRNPEEFHVPWRMNRYILTPGTSREDWMDLYAVVEDDTPGQYLMGDDIVCRLSWGPRGGIEMDK